MKRLLFLLCLGSCIVSLSAQQYKVSREWVTEIRDTTYRERKVWDKEPHERGWRGFAEVAYTIDINAHSGLEFVATYGYQFNNWIYAGVGGGLMIQGISGYYADITHNRDDIYIVRNKDGNTFTDRWLDKGHWSEIGYKRNNKFGDAFYNGYTQSYYNTALCSMPLYANMRIFMLSTKVKPFCDIKLGGLVPLGARAIFYERIVCNYYHVDDNHDNCKELTRAKYRYGGVYFQCGLGAEYRKLSLSFNYAIKGYRALLLAEYPSDSKEVVDIYRSINPGIFTFNIGYSF